MNKASIVALGILVGAAATACGSAPPETKEKQGSNTSVGRTQDTSGNQPDDDADDTTGGSSTSGGSGGAATACVAKDATANAAGVGAYCDGATKCASDRVCTKDFGAPEGAWFCTKMCATDADCGDGAFCHSDPRGKGCVVTACQK